MLRAMLGGVFGTFWGRAALVSVLLLFGFTAVFMPLYNPLTRGSMLGAASMNNVWAEVNIWRMSLHEAVQSEGDWPQDIHALGLPPSQLIDVESPKPFRLAVNMRELDILGNVAGTQLLLDLDPRANVWACSQGFPPIPARYLPINCRTASDGGAAIPGSSAGWYWLVIVLLLMVIGALYLLLSHPLILPIQRQPARLLRVPFGQLPQVDRILGLLGRRKTVLQLAGVLPSDWQAALDYSASMPGSRAQRLAQRLGARWQPASGWNLPGSVCEWQFADDLPVGLDRCLVFEAETGVSADALLYQLRALQTGLDVMLVLDAGDDAGLFEHCQDHANLMVLLDSTTQTELLLARKPADVLLARLAAQLRLTRISPYQTRGGVARAGAFFGRTQVLGRILNREPSNYLVVGGRQLGKSSLLKAVQRRLQGHPQMVCHYVSLRDQRLAPRLALQFGLDAGTSLEGVVEHIAQAHAGKRVFLLIDEADQFFRAESQDGYRQLMTLRALSEEGRCWFMLAGFWDLYATAVLDYQSPLRNFGEVVSIGALEPEACRELAQVPLQRLRLTFADKGVVEQLVTASGQRANLVAIICQECLEALKPGERVISKQHLDRALASQAVQDALAGWGRLSSDDLENRLDRCIVYYVACHGGARLGDLVQLFQQQAIALDVERLRQAFARLVLAFVIKADGPRYVFCIPLFAAQFEPSELSMLLRRELDGLATHVN